MLTLPVRAKTAGADLGLYLNRLSFGVRGQDLTGITDPLVWLEDQLAMPADHPDLTALLAKARLRISYEAASDENGNSWDAKDELRPLDALTADPADYLYCIDWEKGMAYAERSRPAHEVIAAALIRAVNAPAQLREVMTQFWHDHFNVNATKDEFCSAFFPGYDALLRAHAFGNFRELLGQVARAPAMLYYLNNADSKASPANENYARELLELHTLGAGNYLNDRYDDWQSVPKDPSGVALGYMDLDVYEVARAFTGWSVGDGRYVSEGADAPKTGRFHYIESWHDPYQKRILGVEFLPNRAPMADGDDVLDLLASHPGTARFVCTKLARRLFTDAPPPDVIDHLTAVFLAAKDAPDQIAQVVRALVPHPAFAATPPSKIRRPFEFLAALYRATGAQITGVSAEHQWVLTKAGWRQHEYGPPTGHPDVIAAWTGASALNRLVELSLYAHEDWFAVATLDTHPEPNESLGDYIARWANRFGMTGLPDLFAATDSDPAAPMSGFTEEEVKGLAAAAIGFAALRPEFLLR